MVLSVSLFPAFFDSVYLYFLYVDDRKNLKSFSDYGNCCVSSSLRMYNGSVHLLLNNYMNAYSASWCAKAKWCISCASTFTITYASNLEISERRDMLHPGSQLCPPILILRCCHVRHLQCTCHPLPFQRIVVFYRYCEGVGLEFWGKCEWDRELLGWLYSTVVSLIAGLVSVAEARGEISPKWFS
jgi:hypothetical protein